MRMRTDLVVSIGTATGSAVIGLAVVPVYVRLLGVEAYGLVGFLALLQSALAIFDLGLMPTATRDVAEQRARGNVGAAQSLIASLAWLYGIVGLVIGGIVVASSQAIATGWLEPRSLSVHEVSVSVALIGVILAVRWPSGIYTGALIGCRKLTFVSLANFASVALASGGGVAILMFVSPRIELLFAWQALMAGGLLLMLRNATRRNLGVSTHRFDYLKPIVRVWKFSAAIGVISIIGLILTQLDKALVSKFLTLKMFGVYSISVVLGRSLYTLINPITSVIQPRFVALVATESHDELEQSYHLWSSVAATVFFPATLAIVVGAAPLLDLWLPGRLIGGEAAPIVALIAIGAGFHGVMAFPFALQMAAGDARTPLITNLILLAFYVPTVVALVLRFGAVGAAAASMLLFIGYFCLGTWMAHRRLFPSLARGWVLLDIGLPASITLLISAAAMVIVREIAVSPIMGLGIAGLSAALAFGIASVTVLIRFPAISGLLRIGSATRQAAT